PYQRLPTEVTNGGDQRPRPNVIKPLRSSRRRRRKSPNGAGGVHFNQSTGRWMGRHTTDDPETGLRVGTAVYGRSEQEARRKLIEALAARQAGTRIPERDSSAGASPLLIERDQVLTKRKDGRLGAVQ